MARYIDAEELYKETEKKIKEANSYRMAVVDSEFLDLINDAETADVAPKSEVAREIFAEIDKIRLMEKCFQRVNVFYDTASEYEKLKKKYTEGEG